MRHFAATIPTFGHRWLAVGRFDRGSRDFRPQTPGGVRMDACPVHGHKEDRCVVASALLRAILAAPAFFPFLYYAANPMRYAGLFLCAIPQH